MRLGIDLGGTKTEIMALAKTVRWRCAAGFPRQGIMIR